MQLSEFNMRATKIPDAPGVYFFLGPRKRILYIGKAASLRDRVRSYFSRDLIGARSPAIVGMVGKATAIKWLKTDSVLEALILEANLIKKHQPPFNTEQKDDKSWNYVVITKEKFPRVLLVRTRELSQQLELKRYGARTPTLFGPFPHGGQLKEALRIVRKIFPYRDTCIPQSGKPCFNSHIGLCPGVCSGEISEQEYAKTIRNIRELFSGNFQGLKRRLSREMKAAVKLEQYEQAEQLHRQVSALEHIRDVSLLKSERRVAGGGVMSSRTFRVEAYDVAHTAGAETVGVMTVVEDGEPVKAEYRTFAIRGVRNDDIGALREMLVRRLTHPEWRLPRLIVIDGGRAQLRAAKTILEQSGIGIPVTGVVKDEFHRPREIIGEKSRVGEEVILLANSEAHRFALAFHRKRRGRLAR